MAQTDSVAWQPSQYLSMWVRHIQFVLRLPLQFCGLQPNGGPPQVPMTSGWSGTLRFL